MANRSILQTRDTAIALAQKLEVTSGLHRVAVAKLGSNPEMPDFNGIQVVITNI